MNRHHIPLGRRYGHLPRNARRLKPIHVIDFVLELARAHPEWFSHIEPRVNYDSGCPRRLSVVTLIAAGIASGLNGTLFVRDIARLLRELEVGDQRRLGVRWVDPKRQVDGAPRIERQISDRQVEYLVDQINSAFANAAHDHNLSKGEFVIAGDGSGEIIGNVDDLTDDELADLTCWADCPANLTMEALGNRLLALVIEHFHLDGSTGYALDSYLLKTHYATKSYGSKADLNPTEVSETDRDLTAPITKVHVVGAEPGHGTARQTKQAQQRVQAIQRQNTIAASEQARAKREGNATCTADRGRSRAIPPVGPTVTGRGINFIDPEFPQLRPDDRLAHTKDHGAALGYQGAGASRKSGFANGRDKHMLVTSGLLPDGTPYPALTRLYRCVPGGSPKGEAALHLLNTANEQSVQNRHVSLDRIYTMLPPPKFELPARDLGWDIVKDLTEVQRKLVQVAPGIYYVDGWYFTSGLPKNLRSIPRCARYATPEQRTASRQRFDARLPFIMRSNGKTSSGGLRLRGPAVPDRITRDQTGHAVAVRGVRVRCINSPYYRLVDLRLPKTACVKDRPCGCSETLTVAREDIQSSIEPRIFGSTKWAAAYTRRNLVEVANSIEEYHNRIGGHSIRVRAEKWDFAHMLLAASNLLISIHNFFQRLGAHALDPETYPTFARRVFAACLARVGIHVPEVAQTTQLRS